jgi:hypothetical protein
MAAVEAEPQSRPDELPVVAALRGLSIFSADQSGAYREHFAAVARVLGDDVRTMLGQHARRWAESGTSGVLVLTGNAGTGKTAVAQAYCDAVDSPLPDTDDPVEVRPGRWVVKDLSGLPDGPSRLAALRQVLDAADGGGQALVCANEGVLRDALPDLGDPAFASALESALRQGAATEGRVTVANANRQRPTSARLWKQLVDYVTREELWHGCDGCPSDAGGCPMRANAAALRRPNVQEQLRTLVRLGTGEAVPTMREVLAILSWAIVGGQNCGEVKARTRDLGESAYTAAEGYFTRAVGGGLTADAVERSPLLSGMQRGGLGDVSDLEVDGWLRDTTGAPEAVRALAGDPYSAGAPTEPGEAPAAGARAAGGLAGSRSPLDRVRTNQGSMTFQALGEMVSTDEDSTRVDDGLKALVDGGGGANAAGQALWRQRLYFEAADDLGGPAAAARRLLDFRYLPDLVAFAGKAAAGGDTVFELTEVVRGLNFLVTGFASPHEGLVVPDPACLFARDPGSFRPARPSLVHSQVEVGRIMVSVPDRGLVEDLVDVDHVDVDLVVDPGTEAPLVLRIRPRMYEAIREAAQYQGPVGQGVAEMNDLRGFYGRLATRNPAESALRVADPDSSPPALVKIVLPHFATPGRS